MILRQISIENFGGIESYGAELEEYLTIIDNRYTDEIAEAIRFLLCNGADPEIPAQWVRDDTRICATADLMGSTYSLCARPMWGRLRLFVTDSAGADVTTRYRYVLAHCREQEDVETFDGQEKDFPWRLYKYYRGEEIENLSRRTDRIADTKTFRKYLRDYIRGFSPEPICSKKPYLMGMKPKGEFTVYDPRTPGEVCLSETEEKLFRYLCFLRIAEFWADFEKLRDLRHEKKPLLVSGFMEYLDETADIGKLMDRTKKLHRQIMIFTIPLDQKLK